MKMVLGLFKAYDEASRAVTELEKNGYTYDDMAVIAREYVIQISGLAKGVATGATAGGLAGLFMGLTALVIPGIGPALATASIVGSTALGAGFGATVGGIVSTLVDIGLSTDEAELYAEGIKRGGILLAVTTRNTNQEVEVTDILKHEGAVDIKERRKAWNKEGWEHFDETQHLAV